MDKDNLIMNALKAMKKAQDVKVNGKNLDVLIVGKDQEAKLLSTEEIDKYLADAENFMDVVN